MTTSQDKLYWREWAAVRRVLPDADRHELHAQALGADKSHKTFTNAELDQVLALFRAITKPDSLNAQLRQIEQPRTRFLHRIRDQIKCLALFVDHPTAYAAAILRDRFNTEFLEDLSAPDQSHPTDPSDVPDSDLEMMRNTLGRALARLRHRHNAAAPQDRPFWTPEPVETEHEMCLLAGVQCFRHTTCAACRKLTRQEAADLAAHIRHQTQTPDLETNPF